MKHVNLGGLSSHGQGMGRETETSRFPDGTTIGITELGGCWTILMVQQEMRDGGVSSPTFQTEPIWGSYILILLWSLNSKHFSCL